MWSETTVVCACACVRNVMAHTQKPDFVFRRHGGVHLIRREHQFSRLLAAEVCASALVMLDTQLLVTQRSEVVWESWLPTPFASFPFTFPPVRHRVPSGFKRTLQLPQSLSVAGHSPHLVFLLALMKYTVRTAHFVSDIKNSYLMLKIIAVFSEVRTKHMEDLDMFHTPWSCNKFRSWSFRSDGI
jgi:hypothetical protein